MSSDNTIYVTSEISKQFFAASQSGGTFLPPEEIIASTLLSSVPVENLQDKPLVLDNCNKWIQLNINLFKFCPSCGCYVDSLTVAKHLEDCVGKENFKITEKSKAKTSYECEHCDKVSVSYTHLRAHET